MIALVLANNLHLNGFPVTTFHPFLEGLQDWFPELPLSRFPENLDELKRFDHYFIIYEKLEPMQRVIQWCQQNAPKKMTILNPIATFKRDYPYWENGRFDGRLPFVENLFRYCRDILQLKITTKSNGIIPHLPEERDPRRVVIHPMSSREGKNWPRERYLTLAEELIELGFQPEFILTPEEQKRWDAGSFPVVDSHSLDAMARAVHSAGAMVGNDSGVGHLASCLRVPTVTISRNRQSVHFWRPAWERGEVVVPPVWLPNLKGLRWRDRHWKQWISVSAVMHRFKLIIGH